MKHEEELKAWKEGAIAMLASLLTVCDIFGVSYADLITEARKRYRGAKMRDKN